MNFCPQCRTQLEMGARFCANCGHTLAGGPPATPAAGPRPFAGAPGYGPPPAAPGYAPPAAPGYGAQPPAPPGYGAPPAGPPGYGAPPPGPPGYGPASPPGPGYPAPAPVPPPPADEGGGMKVLGGCGVAGCVGAVFAALMVVGLIMVLVVMSGSSGGGGGPSAGPGEAPSSGSVRDIVRTQVGAYTLIGTAPLDQAPAGVVDSIVAQYSGPGGVRIGHVLLVYPSEAIAADRVENVWNGSISKLKPGQKISRGDLTTSSGVKVGTVVALTGVNPDEFYWNNRKLAVIVTGPAPHAKAFATSTPY